MRAACGAETSKEWTSDAVGGGAAARAADARRRRRSSTAVAHAGIAHSVPLILAAAQPHPLINHCCGAAATVDERGRRTAKRRPSGRRLPLLSIASSAASPARRTCGRKAAPGPRLARVCPPGTRVSAPLRARVRRGRLKQVRAGVGSAARDGQRAGRTRPFGDAPTATCARSGDRLLTACTLQPRSALPMASPSSRRFFDGSSTAWEQNPSSAVMESHTMPARGTLSTGPGGGSSAEISAGPSAYFVAGCSDWSLRSRGARHTIVSTSCVRHRNDHAAGRVPRARAADTGSHGAW